MSDLKKPASSLKDKFDVARSVELPSHVPGTLPSPLSAPVPAPRATSFAPAPKNALISLPFTFAFQKSDFETATALAAKIGCTVDDILLLIAKGFDEQVLDLMTAVFNPRYGPSKRVLLKISHATIAQIRQNKDPLNIRSDGYLLRAPVIAALDKLATIVLTELEQHYGS